MTSDQLTRPTGSAGASAGPAGRLPFGVHVLPVGTSLVLTTEFVVGGLLPLGARPGSRVGGGTWHAC
ncbi:hypothetical protein [Geodermatophilus sp. SYSU D00815]